MAFPSFTAGTAAIMNSLKKILFRKIELASVRKADTVPIKPGAREEPG